MLSSSQPPGVLGAAVPSMPTHMAVQVHQFDFYAAGGASGEANNEAVSNLAGVRPGHLLMAEWNNSVGRPCHYVAADLANHFIVVAVRCDLCPLVNDAHLQTPTPQKIVCRCSKKSVLPCSVSWVVLHVKSIPLHAYKSLCHSQTCALQGCGSSV